VEEDPGSADYFVEGNPAQYTWMVPYDIGGLIDLMGGNAKAVERLDKFFTELNAGAHKPYFWIGNEPVFAVPWAYDFAGAPWATQAVTRRSELELYTSQPSGEPGNEDLGATSAWYVFAALGVYPAIPAVGGVALNSPLFPSATIHLGNGKIVKIEGEGADASNPYVQSLLVNGKPSETTWIPYETLSQGATLEFKLGSTPNKQWGTKPEDAPPSFEEVAPATDK
jgi:predicted alpha-1,2-mannosidase